MGNLFASDPPPPPRSPYSTRIPTPPPSPPKPPPTEFARPFPHAGFDPTYGADVLRAMFEREKEPDFDDTQEWLKYRRTVVDYTMEYGDHIGARLSVMHSAISMLDRVLKVTKVHRDQLGATAIACAHMAIKFEEKEEDVPTIPTIRGYTQGQFNFTSKMMMQYEWMIFRALKWNLTTYNALHFTMHWLAQGVIYPTDKMAGNPCNNRVVKYLRRYTDFFADLCLQDYSFQRFRESVKGAAFLYSSRRAMSIEPIWPDRLVQITTYTEEALSECAKAVWDCYRKNFPNAPKVVAETTMEEKNVVSEKTT
ncbi:MAG: hypothetical protein CMQ40_07830 [Gammaproteobacteria bacterium]|nr:hypothetical protein [Gammaproteobacteria bacterium]